jgi:Fic family protein
VTTLSITQLAGVIYTSGKVFDGLSTGRLDTENFLRTGSLEGITSRADLALLEDLRDMAKFVIENQNAHIDAAYVQAVNASITRSGPLRPGELRTAEQNIGVQTPFGRHEPEPVTEKTLQIIVAQAAGHTSAREQALALFVELAKAQPFEDGNKRTALFVANSVLIRSANPELLTIPFDERDPSVAQEFNQLLARAYINNEPDGVKALLRQSGFAAVPAANAVPSSPAERLAARKQQFPELFVEPNGEPPHQGISPELG